MWQGQIARVDEAYYQYVDAGTIKWQMLSFNPKIKKKSGILRQKIVVNIFYKTRKLMYIPYTS